MNTGAKTGLEPANIRIFCASADSGSSAQNTLATSASDNRANIFPIVVSLSAVKPGFSVNRRVLGSFGKQLASARDDVPSFDDSLTNSASKVNRIRTVAMHADRLRRHREPRAVDSRSALLFKK